MEIIDLSSSLLCFLPTFSVEERLFLTTGFFSLVMRAELAAPGLDIVADGQAWNVIITAHGLLMVFFVVMPALIGGLEIGLFP